MRGGVPEFWWNLSDADKYGYLCLRSAISSNGGKSQRTKRIATFTECVENIRRYAVRGNDEDAVRCAVCGICWLPDGIAINTRQLMFLIGKCKSSINGSLQKMGFNVNLARTDASAALFAAMPCLKDKVNEIRKWTVRKLERVLVSPPPRVEPGERPVFEINLGALAKPKVEEPEYFDDLIGISVGCQLMDGLDNDLW